MKSNNFISKASFDGQAVCELSGDYILPDTYPDVKKVLRVHAKPVLIGRYVSGRHLEISGAVDYTVLFCADGEAGETLHCVHFAKDWESSVNELDMSENSNITITPRVSACTQRLANPRKLSLKSTITSDIKLTSLHPVTPSCEGASSPAEELQLEKLTTPIISRGERTFLADVLRISEDIEPDGTQGAIDEIISCCADICIHEAKISRDGDFTVSLKGEALVNCIYKSQSQAGEYTSFSRKCPVIHTVSAAEYEAYFSDCRPESLTVSASATTVEVNAEVAENAYGERRVVQLDLSADVTLCIAGDMAAHLVLDAYSTSRGCECITDEVEYEDEEKIIFSNFSVGESASRTDYVIPDTANIVDTAADILMDSLTFERGRAILSGTASLSCILKASGEYMSAEINIPVRCELNAGDFSEPISMHCEAKAHDIRARLDSERIYFDFEVSLWAKLCERSRRKYVSAIRLIGESKASQTQSTVTLCYPSGDDTLWNIAKRYGTTVEAIEAANPSGGRVLMVPCAPRGIVI